MRIKEVEQLERAKMEEAFGRGKEVEKEVEQLERANNIAKIEEAEARHDSAAHCGSIIASTGFSCRF